MLRALIAALCIAIVATPCVAVPTISVQEVIELCETGFGLRDQAPSMVRKGTCIAYLDAVVATIAQVGSIASSQTRSPRKLLFCLPQSVGYDELSRVFIAFARKNEQHMKLAGASLVIAAFADKYPCK
jgi:hypothetical protein